MFTITFWFLTFQCRGEFEKSRYLAALAWQDPHGELPPDRKTVWMLVVMQPIVDLLAIFTICDVLGTSKWAAITFLGQAAIASCVTLMAAMMVAFALGGTSLPLITRMNGEINRSS